MKFQTSLINLFLFQYKDTRMNITLREKFEIHDKILLGHSLTTMTREGEGVSHMSTIACKIM